MACACCEHNTANPLRLTFPLVIPIRAGFDMPFINLALLSYKLGVLNHEAFDIVIPKHANGLELMHAANR